MNTKRTRKPTMQEALDGLRQLLDLATYSDIDATTHGGAKKIAARWAMADMALQTLAAAPDLLAACIGAAQSLKHADPNSFAGRKYRECMDAVAKADGR